MSDLDTRIRAFVGELLDRSPIAPDFPNDPLLSRARPTARGWLGVAAAAFVGVLVLGWAVSIAATDHPSTRVHIRQSPTDTTASNGARLPASRFAVRVVVADRRSPCLKDWVSAPLEHECLLLGRIVVSTADVASATAIVDPASDKWQVLVTFDASGSAHWEQFLRSAALTQVAILIDGAVAVSPTISPGSTDPTLLITGLYDESTARHVAAELSASP